MDSSELLEKQKYMWEKIDERFSTLEKLYGNVVYCGKKDSAIYDGCLDVKRYANSPIHIMWILKEHNDEPGSLDNGHLATFADCLGPADTKDVSRFKRNVSIFRSLRLIERASRTLLNLPEGDSTIAFKSVAIVNLGKCIGNNTTPNSRLFDLIKWWGELLSEQVSIYKPDVIIVPGSHFKLGVRTLLGCNNATIGMCKEGRAKSEIYTTKEQLPVITIQHPSWYGCKEEDWISALSWAFHKIIIEKSPSAT